LTTCPSCGGPDTNTLTRIPDTGAKRAGIPRRHYDRKRAQGKRHTQAVLALARRRLNVMWAMLRDHKPYQPTPPNAAAA
jgi:hypothetical protein